MATFPLLKTGAVCQYPISRNIRYRTEVLEFVDGTVQTYREYPGALRRWIIRLHLLDPGEIRRVEQFFLEMQGTLGTFVFVDPGEHVPYENCSFESSRIEFHLSDEACGRGTLVVRQNRA